MNNQTKHQTLRLLKDISENARMGKNACEQLLAKTENRQIVQELRREQQQYISLSRRADQLLQAMDERPKPEGVLQRMGQWMGMQMDTLTDRSPAHLADMLIQGATMGVVEMTKARSANPDADEEAQAIAAEFIASQQAAIDRLKIILTQAVPAGK